MVDTYTITGPPGTDGAPVEARVVYRAAGTLFVGPTFNGNHVGSTNARIEMGTWGASADPAFPEDFRVSPFDTSGNFLKSFSSGFVNTGTIQPEFPVELVMDQVLVRTVGQPFDVAFGMDTTGNGAGNTGGTASPSDADYFVATIDWELPPGYTLTSVLGWTDPDPPPPSPWTDVRSGLAGVNGVPALAGTGTLLPGSAGSLSLGSARPSSPALLFVSVAGTPTAFKGGTLVALPPLLSIPLVTDGGGAVLLPFAWPAGVPAATSLWFQCLVQDPAAVQGVAISNGLKAVTP